MLEPPPKSTDGLNVEHPIRTLFYESFKDFFNVFEAHYSSRFEWFTAELGHSASVAVIGSGKGGAEAFALMWHLRAKRAVGFDKQCSCIRQSLRNRRNAIALVDTWVPHVIDHANVAYRRCFQDWYARSVRHEIRRRQLPDFLLSDIRDALPCKKESFDVCYSRYLIDKIQFDLRLKVVSEMVRITRRGGHIIMVAPERAFSFDRSSLGLTLIKIVRPRGLGGLEWEENPPIGKLFRKA